MHTIDVVKDLYTALVSQRFFFVMDGRQVIPKISTKNDGRAKLAIVNFKTEHGSERSEEKLRVDQLRNFCSLADTRDIFSWLGLLL